MGLQQFEPTNQTFQAALQGLKLFEQLKELEGKLEVKKLFLRDAAGGEKLDIDVPNLGRVQVKTPAPASSGFTTQFDEEKYNALPKETKDLLTSLGVVTRKRYSKPESKAAVTFTLNV